MTSSSFKTFIAATWAGDFSSKRGDSLPGLTGKKWNKKRFVSFWIITFISKISNIYIFKGTSDRKSDGKRDICNGGAGLLKFDGALSKYFSQQWVWCPEPTTLGHSDDWHILLFNFKYLNWHFRPNLRDGRSFCNKYENLSGCLSLSSIYRAPPSFSCLHLLVSKSTFLSSVNLWEE